MFQPRVRSAVVLVAAVALGALAVSATAGATKLTGKGTGTYVPLSAERMQLADGTMVERSHSQSLLMSDAHNLPFDGSPHDCYGTMVIAPDGTMAGSGYCDAIDADGDAWFLSWISTGQTGTWQVAGGTGKYAGMTGNGTTTMLAMLPDGRHTIQWTGNWDMQSYSHSSAEE